MNSDFNVAVHALVYLSHKADTVSSEDLASNICTNAARVRKVMACLKRAGLAESSEGAEGGYRIAKPAVDITLANAADAVGCRFVQASWRSGDVNKECLVSSGMGGVMDDLYDQMDVLCRQHLAKQTIADIEQRIFGNRQIRSAS